MTQNKIIDLTIMSNEQCEEFMHYLDTTGFTNYFDTRVKKIKLIHAYKYMPEIYEKFRNEILEITARKEKQELVKLFLESIEIEVPRKTNGVAEDEWLFIRINWFRNLLDEKENIEMKKITNNLVVLNKEEIKSKLQEANEHTENLISEVAITREDVVREITTIETPKKKVNKRSLWKTQLVHDLVTDNILPCEEYLKSKNAIVKKGNTWHIDHEIEVEFKGQKLNARWYKEENSSLQNEQQEL